MEESLGHSPMFASLSPSCPRECLLPCPHLRARPHRRHAGVADEPVELGNVALDDLAQPAKLRLDAGREIVADLARLPSRGCSPKA